MIGKHSDNSIYILARQKPGNICMRLDENDEIVKNNFKDLYSGNMREYIIISNVDNLIKIDNFLNLKDEFNTHSLYDDRIKKPINETMIEAMSSAKPYNIQMINQFFEYYPNIRDIFEFYPRSFNTSYKKTKLFKMFISNGRVDVLCAQSDIIGYDLLLLIDDQNPEIEKIIDNLITTYKRIPNNYIIDILKSSKYHMLTKSESIMNVIKHDILNNYSEISKYYSDFEHFKKLIPNASDYIDDNVIYYAIIDENKNFIKFVIDNCNYDTHKDNPLVKKILEENNQTIVNMPSAPPAAQVKYNDICPICNDNIIENGTTNQCGHSWHIECMRGWNKGCPYCNAKIDK